MNGLSIDGAIRALQQARERVGGDAPLRMADELPVYSLNPHFHDGPAVYVCDVAPDGGGYEIVRGEWTWTDRGEQDESALQFAGNEIRWASGGGINSAYLRRLALDLDTLAKSVSAREAELAGAPSA
jgi:hypothetical protein